jgi:competence protein ComEC
LWAGACAVVRLCAGWRVTTPGWMRARVLVSPVTLLAAAVLAALVWVAALAQPDGRLHVWFLDVGQGDGILIQTPSGGQVLIDGGSSAQVLLGQLGSVMPFWDRTLDLVVLTHPDDDHMAAQVEAIGRFTVDAAWETPASAASLASSDWRSAMQAAGAQVQVQFAGGWADLGDGVALWVLGPPAQGFSGKDVDNENSLVAKLVDGDFSVLLTGDAGDAAEQALIAQGAPLPSTVLKVAHHGSKFSSGERFVAAVNPPLAVIQVGAGNDYGHPSTETLVRLQGQLVLRNDQHGRIHFWSDGQKLWITPHILRDSANSRGKVESLHTIRSWFLAGICALVPPVEKEVVL